MLKNAIVSELKNSKHPLQYGELALKPGISSESITRISRALKELLEEDWIGQLEDTGAYYYTGPK